MSTPFESAVLAHSLDNGDGTVSTPICCGHKMLDDGGCSDGCCDDYRCEHCGKKIRVEWGD